MTGVASTIMPNTAVHSTTDRQLQFHAEELVHGNSVIVGHGTVHLLLSRRWDVARKSVSDVMELTRREGAPRSQNHSGKAGAQWTIGGLQN